MITRLSGLVYPTEYNCQFPIVYMAPIDRYRQTVLYIYYIRYYLRNIIMLHGNRPERIISSFYRNSDVLY